MCQGWLKTVSCLGQLVSKAGETSGSWLRENLKNMGVILLLSADGNQLAKAVLSAATDGARLICRYVRCFA
ncbi:hypothetical protein NIES4075_53060 [Tolypothrix sp. NIES-4075]|nr:hypothetical protein NIES4075_53060 [Tolypothrix sp. NIES-4075]